ncbi:MAG: extracellular solute-binding protein [Anaerolineae bacterium]|nr:extracellular solute-binding protein [Anaerolineae bacterium]
MKRLLPLLLIAVFVVAAVGAPAKAQDKTTIRLWHGWGGDYQKAIIAEFENYNATNTDGITVELVQPANQQEALNTAIAAGAEGDGPDINAWVNDQIGGNVVSGNIIPLDDYGVDKAFLESVYEPAAVTGMIYQDKIYGLPETQEAITLLCNSALVSPEDFPTDPQDFNGLYEAAKKFRDANPDKYLIVNQGWGGSDAYHNAPMFYGFGGNYVDENGVVGLNTPEGLAAGEWLLKMTEVAPAEISGEQIVANIVEGKAACAWTGPWNVKGLEDGGINFFFVPFGRPFVGIKTMMLTKLAADRGTAEAAVKVMKWFTSAEVQAKLALENGTVPAQTEALANPDVANDPIIIGFGKQAAIGVPFPNHPFMSQLWGPAGDAFLAIWKKAQTPAEALEAAQGVAEENVQTLKDSM